MFDLSLFDGVYANLELAQFLENATFAGTIFNAYLSSENASFAKNADFRAAGFSLGSSFSNATFIGPAIFERGQFGRDTRFCDSIFKNTVAFSSSRFDGPSFFNDARFCENTTFNSVQFIGPSDFSNTQFDKDLSMNSTSIKTMAFDGAIFNKGSRLFMAKADINRLMVRWDLIKDILSYDSSAYLALVKNYRDLGLGEADDCYYQYRLLSQNQKRWGWSRIIDILAEISCGYGVRPSHPVICSVILVIFCSSILYSGNGLRNPSNKDKRTSFLDSLYYCLAVFFTIPLPELKPTGRYRYVPVFLRAIAWTLFALLIGTLSKIMIK